MDSNQGQTITPEEREAVHAWATQYVISRLGKHASKDDIIFQSTQMTGESWQQAKAFVEEVESEHHQGIAARRTPILLILGVSTFAIGLIATILYLGEIAQALKSSDPTGSLILLGLRYGFGFIFRFGMMAGGAWGIWSALSDIWRR